MSVSLINKVPACPLGRTWVLPAITLFSFFMLCELMPAASYL